MARPSTGFLLRHLSAFFPSFRETDGYRLFAVRHHSALSVLTGMKHAALLSMHCILTLSLAALPYFAIPPPARYSLTLKLNVAGYDPRAEIFVFLGNEKEAGPSLPIAVYRRDSGQGKG